MTEFPKLPEGWEWHVGVWIELQEEVDLYVEIRRKGWLQRCVYRCWYGRHREFLHLQEAPGHKWDSHLREAAQRVWHGFEAGRRAPEQDLAVRAKGAEFLAYLRENS